MRLSNYRVESPVIEVIKTGENLTAIKRSQINFHSTQDGHEYWRLDTIMSDKMLDKFMQSLNNETITLKEKQTLLEKHCTNIQDLIDTLQLANIPTSLKWKPNGPDAWTLTIDDMVLKLMRFGENDYGLTQTFVFGDDGSYYRPHTKRIQTEAPLEDVKKQALDIITKQLTDMAYRLGTKTELIRYVMNKTVPEPGIILSTKYAPEESYAKLISNYGHRMGVEIDGYSEAWEYTESKILELQRLLSRDMKPFTLLMIINVIDRLHDNIRQSIHVKSKPNKRLSDIIRLTIKPDGITHELYADSKNKNIISVSTDDRSYRELIEFRILTNDDPDTIPILNAMLSDTYGSGLQIGKYIDEHTESLYDRFKKCLAGTFFWPN